MKNKGFTLIELLAVIIILGILLLIAIPSVSNYISDSRKRVFVDNVKELVKGASILVTKNKIDVDDPNTTYYIPYTCIPVEDKEKAKSPYGEFDEAYVVVTLDNQNKYDYYFYGRDTQNFGIYPITEESAISEDIIKSGVENLSTNIGIGRRKNIKVYNSDCSVVVEDKKATEKNPIYDDEGNIINNKEALFASGESVNIKMKKLAGMSNPNKYSENYNIKYFMRADSEPTEEQIQSGFAVNVAASNSPIPIYMWFDADTIFWWSEDEEPSTGYYFSYFFCDLVGLREIYDLDLFDTSNSVYMEQVFTYCNYVLTLDVSNFDTSKAKYMYGMFGWMDRIQSLDLSNFDTSNVVSIRSMFYSDYNLKELDISSFNTSKVTNMYGVFTYCHKLESVDVSRFDTSKVYTLAYMFWGCYKITTLEVSNWDTRNVETMFYLFSQCGRLQNINVNNWRTPKVTNFGYIFNGPSITEADLSGWDVSKGTEFDYMISSCGKLKTLNLSGWNLAKATTMNWFLTNCYSLENLDMTNWKVPRVKSLACFLAGCSKITEIDMSGWTLTGITNIYRIFSGCTSLTTIYAAEGQSFSGATTTESAFGSCRSLVGGNGTEWQSSMVGKKAYGQVDGENDLPGLFTLKST